MQKRHGESYFSAFTNVVILQCVGGQSVKFTIRDITFYLFIPNSIISAIC